MTSNPNCDTAPTAPSAGSASPLSLDTTLELLANRHRRFALYTLLAAPDGVMELDVLFDEVATLAAALDETALTRDRYQEIAADLYHWHLPVMADVGVIDRDSRHETIRYRPHPTLETWVERVKRDEFKCSS